MKKATAWMLALCLLALGVPAMAASGSVPLFTLPEDPADILIGFADDPQQGKIYALGYERLYTMNADGSEVRAWEIAPYDLGEDSADSDFAISGVFCWDGAFYALAAGTVYSADQSEVEIRDFGLHALNFDEEAGTVRLELALPMDGKALVQEVDGYAFFSLPLQMIQTDDRLYSMEYMAGGMQLISLDPAAGSVELREISDSTQGLLPYKEGKLLTVSGECADAMRLVVSVLDPETGDLEELFALDLDANVYPHFYAYDAQNDAFYCGTNSELLRRTGAEGALVAVATNPVPYANCGSFTPDGDLLLADYEAIWRVNTDPEERPETRLVVQSNYDSSLEAARAPFQQAHPEVEVVLSQSAGDMAQAVPAQTATPDIYTLSVDSSEYSAAFEHGYMAELTDSEILADFAAAVYPAIQEVIQKDGELYGLPLSVHGRTRISCDPATFEKLGIPEDIPTSWMELFQLLQRLPEALENAPGISAFEVGLPASDMRQALLSEMVDAYMLYISQPENEFSFDTPLFRELMAAFEAVDFEALGLQEGYEGDIYALADAPDPLFYAYGSFDPYVSSWPFQTLYLALDEDMQPLVEASVTVAFVNPDSPNRDLAIEYLECAAEQAGVIARIMMMPGENEPVLNEDFEENLTSYDELIAVLEAQVVNAEAEERQMLEFMLETAKAQREDYQKYHHYIASAESIAAYREAAQYMTVNLYRGLDSQTFGECYEQQNQYLRGAVTLDEFIRNIDQKLRMIVREGQ